MAARGISDVPDWTIDDVERVADIGAGLSGLGDVDADGYDDLLVGSPGSPDGGEAGQVRIYLGGPNGLAKKPAWVEDGDSAGVPLGTTAAGLGDVNGDGHLDFAAAWPAESDGASRIVVYLTGRRGLSDIGRQELEIVADGDFFGSTFADNIVSAFVGGLGDVNADGFDDLLVGSYVPGTAADHIDWQIFLGGPQGVTSEPSFETIRPMGDLGLVLLQVTAAGDLNRDGYADFAFGLADVTSRSEGYEPIPGEVSVYYGGPVGLMTSF